MPLTVEEQAELDSLKTSKAKRVSGPAIVPAKSLSGLNQKEQAELQQLRQKRSARLSQLIPLSADDQLALTEQLGRKLPLTPEQRTALSRTPAGAQSLASEPNAGRRQKAFDALIKQGATRDQIQTVLDIQNRVSPGIIGKIKQNIGEDIGGIAGGAAGAKIALSLGQIPPFTALPEEFVTVPILAGIGSFLGGGSGKNIQQAINPLESPSARDFLRSGTRQGLFELGGRQVSAAARGLGFFKKPVQDVVELEQSKVGELFKQQGGFFLPRQRDARTLVRASEELSRGSFGGGAIFEGFDTIQQGQAVEVGNKIINSIVGDALKDPDVLGDELFEIFVRAGEKGVAKPGLRKTLFDKFFEPLYKEVGRLSPNTRLSTVPVKKWMEKKLKADISQGGALLTSEGRSKFKFALKNLEADKTISEMIELRSSAIKDARKFRVGADKSETVFSELASLYDDALFDPTTATGMTPEAKKLLRNTNAVYGASRELFDEQFVKGVVRRLGTSPGKVVKEVFGDLDPTRIKGIRELLISPVRKVSGVGSTRKSIEGELRTLRNSIGQVQGGEEAARLLTKNVAEGKALWKQLKGAWFSEQIRSAYNPTTKTLNIAQLEKVFKDMPTKTFKLMYPGIEGKNVKDVVKLFKTISPAKKGFVSMFGKSFEIGGITGVPASLAAGSGLAATASGSLAIAPTAFAKLATMGPRVTKLLTLGFNAKAGSIKIAPIAARLINLLNEDAEKDMKAVLTERRNKKQKARLRKVGTQRLQPFPGISGLQ